MVRHDLAGGPVKVGDGAHVLEEGERAVGVVCAVEVRLEAGVGFVEEWSGGEGGPDEACKTEEAHGDLRTNDIGVKE